jgi:pimeloyl-ACP methyl ester carboxylesterase
MATYVLVHGAWHGGWCWNRVAPLLRDKGHDVYTPTLTGLGERVHLATPDVDLSTHIADVVNVIEFEDLRNVILMGHSYGGQVVTGVAGAIPDRIGQLAYLDAFVPGDGQALVDLMSNAGIADRLVPGSSPWQLPIPEPPFGTFGITDDNDYAWVRSKLVPHLLATMTQPVKLPVPLEWQPFGRTYIVAAGERPENYPSPFKQAYARLSQDKRWRMESLPTGHDIMVTMPRELSDILLNLAD